MSRYYLLGICLCWPLWLGAVEGRCEFTTIIDMPPTVDIARLQSNTQVNVFDNGWLPSSFAAFNRYLYNENIEFNIHGGAVESGFGVGYGTVVNISGGLIGSGFEARSGSEMNISGGFHNGLSAADGSKLNLYGAEFRFNGQPVAGLDTAGDTVSLDWSPDSYLSGTLADGTPFVLADVLDTLEMDRLSLHFVELPQVGPSHTRTSDYDDKIAVRGNQSLTVDSNYVNIRAGAGSTINHVEGIASNFQATSTEMNMFGGSAYGKFFGNSVVNVYGGELGASYHESTTVNVYGGRSWGTLYGGTINVFDGIFQESTAYDGEVNVYGGLGGSITVFEDAVANIHGGIVSINASRGGMGKVTGGDVVTAYSNEGGNLVFSGGRILEQLYVGTDGQVTLIGDEFLLDGQSINLNQIGDSLEVQVPIGSVISGFLSDGSPFAFSSDDSVYRNSYSPPDDLSQGRLVLQRAGLPTDNRMNIVASTDPVPLGLRQGQILTVDAGGRVGDYFGAGFGSTVNVEDGGEIGRDFEAAGAQVNVRGGIIGYQFDVSNSSIVEVDGGEIFEGMEVFGGGAVNVRSGRVGDAATVIGSGIMNIYGGDVGKQLEARNGGTINIMGGTIGEGLTARAGGKVNIRNGIVDGYAVVQGYAKVSGGVVDEVVADAGGIVEITDQAIVDYLASNSGASLNISGGTIRKQFDIRNSAAATISGGNIDGRFNVDFFGQADFSGGVIGDGVKVNQNARFTIKGDSFTLNGKAVEGLSHIGDTIQIDVSSSYSLQGVLADGTPFAFSSEDNDSFRPGTIWLEMRALPAAVSKQIIASVDDVPVSVRGDQHVTVDEGGQVLNNFMMGPGSTMEVLNGGKVGDNLEVIGGVVNIRGGEVGRYLDAYGGSVINVESGTVRERIVAHSGSQINVTGGFAGIPGGEWPDLLSRGILAKGGSELNISGGEVGGIGGEPDSTIRISGGRIGPYSGSNSANIVLSGGTYGDHFGHSNVQSLTIKGNNFRMDGESIPGLENVGDSIQIRYETLHAYTGVLQDGTPFALSFLDGDYIDPGSVITLERTDVAPIGPDRIVASTDLVPYGIRDGQRLIVDTGAVVGHSFNAGEGSVVDIYSGGIIKENFEAIGAVVNLNGGWIGNSSAAFHGAVVNINGGDIGYFSAYHGSVVNVNSGSVGSPLRAEEGSIVNIAGGTVGGMSASHGSETFVSGGTFFGGYKAFYESRTFLIGTSFELDGVPLEELPIGVPYQIQVRNVALSGMLARGDGFEFWLNGTYSSYSGDYFAPNASLYVTLVHHSGDYNGDLRVDDEDLLVWQDAMLTGNLAADGNYDRLVNEADRIVWQETYGTNYGQVPEPAALWLLAAMSIVVLSARAREIKVM